MNVHPFLYFSLFDVAKALDAVKADFDKFAKARTALAPATDFSKAGSQ